MKINFAAIIISASLIAVDCQGLKEILNESSQLALGIHEVIDKLFGNYSETANFMSNDPNKSSSFMIGDFKDALATKAFRNPKVVYRHEFSSHVFKNKNRKRRAIVFLAENFQDFTVEHKTITTELFRFYGIFIVALINGKIPEIDDIFRLMWKIQIYNVIVMFEENNEVLVYTFFPFNAMKCDDTTPVLINKIINGNFLNGPENIFPDKMTNLFNCQVRLSAPENEVPFVNVTKLSNGSYELEGLDVTLLNTLAEKLNFKIALTYFSDENYIFDNQTMADAFKVLLDEGADISIGNWYLKLKRSQLFDATTTYSYDSLVFLVPPGAKLTPFEKLIFPFTSVVWCMVLGVFLVGFVVIQILKQQKLSVKNFIFGTRVKHPILNMFSGFIGGMQNILPRRNFARFLLMCFLLYSLVVRTLYQALYFQLFQSEKTRRTVQTIDEIVSKNYKIYVMEGNEDLLQQVEAFKGRLVKTACLQL